MVNKLTWLALAGAIGTLARFALSALVQRLHESEFPWGTLAVNALGCFLFGFVWPLAEERLLIGSETRLIVLTGFMGAFTTFSTFAFETSALARDAQWLPMAGNMLAHNGLGLICVLVGIALGRML